MGSGQTSNIYLNTYNANHSYTSGIEWKPNFLDYSKISAFLRFVPTGNYFRGELHMGANYTANKFNDAPTVLKIKYNGIQILGSITKTSGSFRIPHPLDEKNKTLYHSFVEAPRCDNIYSGKIKLINGKANINMDNNDWYKMSDGTFLELNKDFRIYCNNNEDFDRVIGKLNGNILEIMCENTSSSVEINWMVIGTRKDNSIIESSLTDDSGNLITETDEKNDSII